MKKKEKLKRDIDNNEDATQDTERVLPEILKLNKEVISVLVGTNDVAQRWNNVNCGAGSPKCNTKCSRIKNNSTDIDARDKSCGPTKFD